MKVEKPWSAMIRLGDLGRGVVRRKLEPDAATRAAIARELGLVSIDSLTADVEASAWLDGGEIVGQFSAEVTQTCGVTAEDFPVRISSAFEIRVVPADSPHAPQDAGEEIDLDPEADDPPDVLEDDRIDLAGYVVEHLALELDPFPRKPGAVFTAPEEPVEMSPFAVLKGLKTDTAGD
ncbi:MAG: DUF177 domain-containing protein [Caulobacter sp.]|nr:DUF177 domain-containing protein [Caulobacter sp.]